MGEIVKVVVFHVDVPKDRLMLNTDIPSENFEIDLLGNLSKWKLQCIFNDNLKGTIGIYLHFVSGDLPAKVHSSFSLVNHIDLKLSKGCSYDNLGKEFIAKNGLPMGLGCVSLISHKDLFESQADFFPHGKLTFVAKLIFKGCSKEVCPIRTTKGLEKIYDSMKHSDVVFQTSDDEEVKAHKCVLCAMSDVFDAMFTHETTERASGVIDASDLHSSVVKDLLRFMYCESTFKILENSEGKEVELYYAAEKYQLNELKKICLNAINGRLDAFNVLEFLNFADTFTIKSPFSCCLLIILANFNSISKSDEWKNLKAEVKNLMLEHFAKNSQKLIKSTWFSDDF